MSSSVIDVIHDIALAHSCAYRTDTMPSDSEDGSKTVTRYSLGGLRVEETQDMAHVCITTRFLNIKRLFESSDDPVVRELLFYGLRECTYCISDKCTTMLMAPARTLTLHGQSKQACSMWGQWLRLPVNNDTLAACGKIVERFLSDAETKAEPHADLRDNVVTYTVVPKDVCYLVGYRNRHTEISRKDEDLVNAGLPKMPTLCAALDIPDGGPYAGATEGFINGSQYDFIFGVLLDHKPDAAKLPEGVVVRKIGAGEWAVYNSSLSDYPSIWRHYTDRFYALEQRGWDAARIPFELYDTDGNWRDVHIPVDADAPADAGRVVREEHRPDFVVAGWERVGEEDHPDWYDTTEIEARLQALLKRSGTISFRYCLHAYYGKPLFDAHGVIVDDTLDIPEDFRRRTIKGGLWRIVTHRHFNGHTGEGCWDFGGLFLDHPRVFATPCYNARGGYEETWLPMRKWGTLEYELVELPPLKVFAKLEDPLNGCTVPDAELRTYYTLPGNANPGTLIVGYSLASINSMPFFSAPLIKGVIAAEAAVPPEGFTIYYLDGGHFVKITEVNPDGSPYLRGEPGWEVGDITFPFPDKVVPEFARNTDYSRHCRVLQIGDGKYYALYIPVGQSKHDDASLAKPGRTEEAT